MNASAELTTGNYLDGLLPGDQEPLVDSGPGWLSKLRAEAAERADALDIPTTRNEEWRFTDLSPLLRYSFQPAGRASNLTLADIASFIAPEAATSRLVFVDGGYAPQLSSCAGLPSGIVVSTLAEVLLAHSVPIHAHLARHASFSQDVFGALNTSRFGDGVLVLVAKNHAIATPIHLLFIATSQGMPVVVYPRCLIVAEEGSRCTVIEDYVGLSDNVYFTNAVTEIAVGDNAEVRHAKLQRESHAAFHIAQCGVSLGRDSVYTSTTVTLGARLSRYNLQALQTAEGMQCTLDGLALIGGRQLADTHTLVDHAKPHGRSAQLHKCVVDGAAHAVFNGKVFVREDAQLTDSVQSSRNLLLSDKAHVDTKPQLEIFADDVKCAHGATVGQLDAEELFYLKSRGLSDLAARNLLTYGFAAEIIDKVPVASLREQLQRTVLEQTQVRT